MANPLSRGAATTFPLGPGQTTDNVTGLLAGQAKPLGKVDNGAAPVFDVQVNPVKIKTDAAGWAAGDTCTLYLIHSEDDVTWTDGINPDATADVAASLATAVPVQTIKTEANATTYYFDGFSLFSVLGKVPRYWTLIVLNNEAAAAFSGTAADFAAQYVPLPYV